MDDCNVIALDLNHENIDMITPMEYHKEPFIPINTEFIMGFIIGFAVSKFFFSN
jgi:hypothetical protein